MKKTIKQQIDQIYRISETSLWDKFKLIVDHHKKELLTDDEFLWEYRQIYNNRWRVWFTSLTVNNEHNKTSKEI